MVCHSVYILPTRASLPVLREEEDEEEEGGHEGALGATLDGSAGLQCVQTYKH